MLVAGGVEAWITSAVDDKVVPKALVLAASLRKVRTAKKLAVFTTLAVSKDLREKLKEVFDLVVLLDKEVPNGLNLEDYAKVQAFSLMIFTKCVYLSPNLLVLKNSDEIFDKYTTFAALTNGKKVDPSIYLFTPCLDHTRALEQIVKYVDVAGKRAKGNFSRYFNMWMQNHVPKSQVLDGKFNSRIYLEKNHNKSIEADVTIANFVDIHPLDISETDICSKFEQMGIVEKFVSERCLQIHSEDVKNHTYEFTGHNILSTEQYGHEPIAVVGMSFRLPGGNNVDEFWDLLVNGKDAIVPVPPFRWTKEHNITPIRNRSFQAGFLNVPIDEFDAKFFGLSPKEAIFLDPQQRLLHETTWEAFEDAMIDPLKLHGSHVGVFVGSWLNDYKDIAVRSSDVDFFRTYMGNSIASEAARLSHFLNITGPSIATESGCSSAIVAVHMACDSLKKKESNLAVAAGVNLLIHALDQNTLSFVVAPDGRCKTFDADANGFGRAEACAVLLLKRQSDAIRDGDNIWGLIRGSAVTQEGVSKSLGTPTIHCESLAMELALKDANVHPGNVSYIEAHGTGTTVGDPMEISAITKAYGQGRYDPLLIGSVKTNVGHTESVSGITGIIKVLLSMKNETIPAHLNFKALNPEINLEVIPAEIPLTATPWPRHEHQPRIAGVSSFGISGTDGHAIIQEPPIIQHHCIEFNQERPVHIMKLSAKCQDSLDQLLSKYEAIFTEKAETGSSKDFADVAYSANFGRSTFNHRAVIVAEDFAKAAKIIRDKSFKHSDVMSAGSSICFLFTGQGSQYPNMAAKLYSTSPIFKQTFDKCSNVLLQQYGISITDVLWGNATNAADELSRTLYSQTSIFCVEYCLLKMWQSWGVQPDYVLGHSLGEFAAAVAAGVLLFEDALMLVAERSRLIDGLHRGKMLVIKADKKTVDQTISKYKETHADFWVDFAALNSLDQTVVAGDSQLIEDFAKFCGEQKLKTIVLASTHAFHSRHMDPMLEAYRNVAQGVACLQPPENAPKYISGMEGKLIEVEEIDADYWVRHTREKVSFIDACKVVQSEGCNLFLEVGPHPVLSALVMMNIDGHSVTCLPSIRRKEDEWVTMLDSLSKLFLSEWKGEIDWKGFDKFYSRQRVKLPFYQFNRKPIWIKTRSVQCDLHPLIGKVVPNASRHSVYEQTLTLKKADFAQDHIIGNTIVFPGAGFLEMCLVGGHSCVQAFGDVFQQPRRPVVLKGLKIKSPLALFKSQLCILQTVVELDDKDEDEMGYNVTISRLDESESSNGGHWIQHATAKFLPVAPAIPAEVSPVQVDQILETWEKTDHKDFYERLPEVGLRFGPKFQSLQGGWKHEEGVLLQVKVPQSIDESYVMHPVIADAMLQAAMIWTSKEKVKKKLQVPVHIGEFIWLDSSEAEGRYIYTSNGSNNLAYSLLVDGTGKPLAFMSSIDFAETTVKLVEGMIHQQTAAMPQMWEETWKATLGPLQRRFMAIPVPEISDDCSAELAQHNRLDDWEANCYLQVCDMAQHSVLNALYNLGFNPKVGEALTIESLMTTLGIQDAYKSYVIFFLLKFEELKFLHFSETDSTTFVVSANLPSPKQVASHLNSFKTSIYKDRPEHRMTKEVSDNLPDIFLGKAHPLSFLFPTDTSKPHAGQIYETLMPFAMACVNTINHRHVIPYFKNCIEKTMRETNSDEQPRISILEVGAGTGSWSKKYMDILKQENIDFQYYYTDISAVFFGPAEEALAEHKKSLVFKKFNMEEDPFEQGFSPESFDMILACEVLHIAKELRPTLQRLRSLLRPNGCLQFYETVTKCSRTTFTFGLLDGYWNFRDYDLRPYHACLSAEKWRDTLLEVGFTKVVPTPVYNGVHSFVIAQASDSPGIGPMVQKNYIGEPKFSWVILTDGSTFSGLLKKRLEDANRKVLLVEQPQECTETGMKEFFQNVLANANKDVDRLEGILYLWGMMEGRDQTRISLPLVNLFQAIINLSTVPKITVITYGIYHVNGCEVRDPAAGTLVGLLRSMRNEYSNFKVSHMDLSSNNIREDQINEVFYNLWLEEDAILQFHDGKRYVPRMIASKPVDEYLSLPNGCDRFKLKLPETRLISDLEFIYLDPYTLGETDVEVQIKTMALNFRDVFCVLKPLPIFEEFNTVGLDFCGVVTKAGSQVTTVNVGDRVMGMNLSRNLSLPSHVQIDEHLVARLPENLTFNEAVTLPAVFSTALYCLMNVADMKKGETVLIHTASGGVGICAVQLAQHVGANIIATAGSVRKRNFLRNLGIKHVFNSRTTDFGEQILEVTNGRGVDIVLNSITGPGFKEASLAALTKNGRFIEMSKLSVWKKEEVAELRPDVFYEIVDLTSLPQSEYRRLTQVLKDSISSLMVKPIPYERFDALNIRGALYFLQKAKHIGKVVCVMPEIKVQEGKVQVTTPLFNAESTYLVTGGLGGIGFEVVKWMLENGAKHVAIASRSRPKPEIASQLEVWNKQGKHVEAFSVDVGNYDQCRDLFENFNNEQTGFPQLRGVMHSAGVLHDATIENQNWDKFLGTYNPKVAGTWNLHDLTQDLPLEHFVLFSSITAAFGSPGQSNHSSSNSFEDALIHYRNSIGLTGVSINWGNWGEVGVATEVDFPGLRPVSTKQGLLALQAFLTTNRSHNLVLNLESFGMLAKLFPNIKSYIADKRLLGEAKLHVQITADEFWGKVDAAENRDEKIEVFKTFIKSTVRLTLKMEDDEEIDDNAEFQVLGIDSLMMLEMKNGLQNVLGTRMTLTAAQLKDCNNTLVLANRLVDILEGENETDLILPTKEELYELVREDSKLADHISPSECTRVKDIAEVETVLLTGATGTLGPYLLRDLTQTLQIKKIYCLIRPKGKLGGLERLRSRLNHVGILDEVDLDKVECLQGDITDKRMGLSEEEYIKLAERVDAVVHSAVRADHTAKYWKAPESKKLTVRTANVLGTVSVLEFATLTVLKHVLYASTLLTATKTNSSGTLSEDWEDVGAFDELLDLNCGYPISKHIAEQLVKEATHRGLPIKTFRLPGISGDSRTGRLDFETNHIVLRWLACMRLGSIIDKPAPMPLVPVDTCASLSLKVFFNPTAKFDVYNVCMRKVGLEQDLVHVAKEFGVTVEPVAFEDFHKRLNEEGDGSPLTPFRKAYEDVLTYNEKISETPTIGYQQEYLCNSEEFFICPKLLQVLPNYESDIESIQEIMKRTLTYLQGLGILEKFGIKTSSIE